MGADAQMFPLQRWGPKTWDYPGTILGPSWDHPGTILGTWGHVMVVL